MKEIELFWHESGLVSELKANELAELSPLVLAYIGDAIYEAFIRGYLVKGSKAAVHQLHKLSVGFVSANAQAGILHKIVDNLTEDEREIVRRGRNTKTASAPKNADITTYRYATGFEAMIGQLYLSGQYDRLKEVLNMSLKAAIEKE